MMMTIVTKMDENENEVENEVESENEVENENKVENENERSRTSQPPDFRRSVEWMQFSSCIGLGPLQQSCLGNKNEHDMTAREPANDQAEVYTDMYASTWIKETNIIFWPSVFGFWPTEFLRTS